MNIHEIEADLKKQQFSFDQHFAKDVLIKIREVKKEWAPKPMWLAAGIAASLAFCLLFVYFQEGSITYDSLLGISDLTNDNFSDYLNYLSI